ncbi:RNA-binding S4 domain-containing protein [Mycoplasmopsis mucosicanis]|uniref:RNA-binding S4 domain-containing protein n=1 Tax=Mycoplasmopsis mucosicanis TaxID=458208 RepID=A0A507SJY3_9BACT|nr:RNA-binding S4 domain-containing protein [Mycoplasmopsis mucosicanis]TQC51561.1 RNA-binding S4 domain-containing protein [Mycoplasmopsis mucosicanis]
MKNTIIIKEKYIEIGKLLKIIGLIQTGGQAKYFLSENEIKINNSTPQGRNTKVYVGDVVWINNSVYIVKN